MYVSGMVFVFLIIPTLILCQGFASEAFVLLLKQLLARHIIMVKANKKLELVTK